jgi:adenylyltransferase/sulfurtransferase
VYGSIYKFEGQVSVFNYQNGPTYRCLFKDYPSEESTTDCNVAGVLGVLPGIIGLYQANEVLKIILGIGKTLSGELFVYNGLSNQHSKFIISKIEFNDYSTILKNNQLNEVNYKGTCQLKNVKDEIDIEEFEEKYLRGVIQIIDVRNSFEEPVLVNNSILSIPLPEIDQNINQISENLEVVFLCMSGKRSLSAVNIAREKYNIQNVRSLKGGITDELLEVLEAYK